MTILQDNTLQGVYLHLLEVLEDHRARHDFDRYPDILEAIARARFITTAETKRSLDAKQIPTNFAMSNDGQLQKVSG